MRQTFFTAIICMTLATVLIANPKYDELLDLGNKYLSIGRYEEAEKVYEAMYMEYPGDRMVITGLKTCYFALNKTDKLSDILIRQASLEPDNPAVRIDLGKLHIIRAEPDKAMDAYEEAFKLRPEAISYYEQAFNELSSRGYYDQAEKVVKLARKNLDDESVLSMNMAFIYELNGEFDKAVEEYGKYIDKNPDRFPEVESRIDVTGSSEEDLAKLEEAIEKVFGKGVFSKARVYRLLSRINVRLKDYKKALQNLIDSEKDMLKAKVEPGRPPFKKGEYVYPYANQMLAQNHNEAAAEAGEYLANGDDSFRDRGLLIKAEAFYNLDKEEDATELFTELSESKIQDVKVKSVLRLGQIALKHGDHENARLKLNIVLKSRNTGLIEEGIKSLISSYTATNELEKAKEELKQFKDQFRDAGWYLFELGETELFLGETTDAENDFNLTVSRASESVEANNAVDYLLLLAFRDDPSFKQYIEYRKAVKSGLDGLEVLEGLAQRSSPFQDKILTELAQLYFQMGKPTEASSTAEKCYTQYPESFYAPFCLEIKADVLFNNNPAGALTFYNRILLDYPDYIDASRIREKAKRAGNI